MENLLILLACVFAGVALMVLLTEKFGSTADAGTTARLQRWFMPLVGLTLVLGALKYFFGAE